MGKSIKSRIAKNLKDMRYIRGYTLREVCAMYSECSGEALSPSALSAWENGDRSPHRFSVDILADVYECSVDVLLGRICGKRDEDILADFSALDPGAQSIVRFLARSWSGDLPALINACGCYAAMPENYRGDVSLYWITKYQEAKDRGLLLSDVSVDDSYLSAALDTLIRKG